MNSIEEFEFWLGDCLENPKSLDSETWRTFADMCARGNSHAIAHYEQSQREFRRTAIERGEIIDPDSPLNTVGNLDTEEVDLSIVPSNLEAAYPKNWPELSAARKAYRNWQCELCSFQLHGSSLIQVHHIDRDKSNNEKLNLQVLCAVCHGQVHWSPPVWPRGALVSEKSKLIAHHMSRFQAPKASASMPK